MGPQQSHCKASALRCCLPVSTQLCRQDQPLGADQQLLQHLQHCAGTHDKDALVRLKALAGLEALAESDIATQDLMQIAELVSSRYAISVKPAGYDASIFM